MSAAAIYVRVSSTQQEQDGTSLETQLEQCRAYAVAHGLAVDESHVYREVHTGVELWQRPKLTALRDAVRRREVGVVIAYAIDRLSRDPVHLGVLISEAEHAGVDVQFVSEPLDQSPEGQLIRYVRGYAAKVEHEKLRDRTQRAKLARAEKGHMMHGGRRPLYGYAYRNVEELGRDGKAVIRKKAAYAVNEAEAVIVRRIFAEAAAGISLRRIAFALTDDGIPSPTGKAVWQPATISKMVSQPTYRGEATAFRYKVTKQNGRKTVTLRDAAETIPLPEGVIPPLVDGATYTAAQAMIAENRTRLARQPKDTEKYLLAGGIARCGYCGGSMHAGSRARRGIPYYGCGANKHVRGRCAETPTIPGELIDAAVWDRIAHALSERGRIARELEQLTADDPTEADVAAVDRRVAAIAKQQANVADAIARLDNPDAIAPLTEKLAALAAQRRQLDAERQEVLARQAGREAARRQIAQLEEWREAVAAELCEADFATRRRWVEALNVRVRVWKASHEPRYEVTAAIPLPQGDGRYIRTLGKNAAIANQK